MACTPEPNVAKSEWKLSPCEDALREAATKRQMQIDALYQLFTLHPQKSDLSTVECELTLPHAAHIDFPDAICRLFKLKCPPVLIYHRQQNHLALFERVCSRERILDISDRTQCNSRILCDGRFLFDGSNAHLSFQSAARDRSAQTSRCRRQRSDSRNRPSVRELSCR